MGGGWLVGDEDGEADVGVGVGLGVGGCLFMMEVEMV